MKTTQQERDELREWYAPPCGHERTPVSMEDLHNLLDDADRCVELEAKLGDSERLVISYKSRCDEAWRVVERLRADVEQASVNRKLLNDSNERLGQELVDMKFALDVAKGDA